MSYYNSNLLRTGNPFVTHLWRSISSMFTTTIHPRTSCFRLVLLVVIIVMFGSNVLVSSTNWLAKNPWLDLLTRIPSPTANFDGRPVSVTENPRKAIVQGPRHDGINPRDIEDWLKFQPQHFFLCWDSTPTLTSLSFGLRLNLVDVRL
jgi:hypothetical protein